MNAKRIPSTNQVGPAFLDHAFMSFWEERTRINQAILALEFAVGATIHSLTNNQPLDRLSLKYSELPDGFDVSSVRALSELHTSQSTLLDASFLLAQPAYEHYLGSFSRVAADLFKIKRPKDTQLHPLHEWLKANGFTDLESTPQFELLDFLRLVRNCHIHRAGIASPKEEKGRNGLSGDALNLWRNATGQTLPQIQAGALIDLGPRGPIGAIYTAGVLAVELNHKLQADTRMNDDLWADLIVHSFRLSPEGESRWKGSRIAADRFREMSGFAKYRFGAALPKVASDSALLSGAIARAPLDIELP